MPVSLGIETARLKIVLFEERHLTERYVSWLNDSETMRFSEQRHVKHTLASCREYWQSFKGTKNYFWAIEKLDLQHTHIGNMNAYLDERHNIADVGLLIGERSSWGKGLGTEAFGAACTFLFSAHSLRKITAGTVSANKGMLNIMWRSGMVEDGRRVRHFVYDNVETDLVFGALFRESWAAMKTAVQITGPSKQ